MAGLTGRFINSGHQVVTLLAKGLHVRVRDLNAALQVNFVAAPKILKAFVIFKKTNTCLSHSPCFVISVDKDFLQICSTYLSYKLDAISTFESRGHSKL